MSGRWSVMDQAPQLPAVALQATRSIRQLAGKRLRHMRGLAEEPVRCVLGAYTDVPPTKETAAV